MPGEACWPCRERKLKCDAATTGVPCARCQDTSRVDDCIVPPRQKRTINRHKRARLNSVCDSARRKEPQEQPSVVNADDHVRERGLTNDGQSSPFTAIVSSSELPTVHRPTSPLDGFGIPNMVAAETPNTDFSRASGPSNYHDVERNEFLVSTSVPEESGDDILARVCQEMASPNTRASGTVMGSSWAKSMEYHNSFNATGILGEVLAGRESNKFIAIERGALRTRRDDELCGLDEHDINYLQNKGVFKLPPRDVWCVEHPKCIAWFR